MKKKALLISQHYHPEPNFIITDIAEELARNNWNVLVITCFPNYPMGSFYPGTRWWLPQWESKNGTSILRLPHFPDHSLSLVKRGLSYLSFALIASVVAPFVCFKPKVVWVYQTPFSCALASLVFKVLYRAKLVFMYADLWPESFIATDTVNDGILIKACLFYRKIINRFADYIIGSTKGTCLKMAGEVATTHKVEHIPVWVNGIPETLSDYRATQPPTVVYAGNLGVAQNLDSVLYAAKHLEPQIPDLAFHIIGSGTEEARLKMLAKELRLTNIRFLGRLSPEEAFRALKESMAQIIILEDTKYFSMTVPSKLFTGFAAGAPMLVGLTGEALTLATQSGGAVAFKSSDPVSLANAVKLTYNLTDDVRTQMRQRLQDLYKSEFSRSILLGRHMKLLNSI